MDIINKVGYHTRIMNNQPYFSEKLFSYGTLQLESVQLATFGRPLNGKKDFITGYKLEPLKILDPSVIAISGTDTHFVMIKTNNSNDQVEGMVFEITKAELEQADAYEVDDYKRIEIKLNSGNHAWVYINAN